MDLFLQRNQLLSKAGNKWPRYTSTLQQYDYQQLVEMTERFTDFIDYIIHIGAIAQLSRLSQIVTRYANTEPFAVHFAVINQYDQLSGATKGILQIFM